MEGEEGRGMGKGEREVGRGGVSADMLNGDTMFLIVKIDYFIEVPEL